MENEAELGRGGAAPRRVGIADVRASQNLARASLPLLMRHLFVPIAWPLTVAAARLGFSPNGATAARGLLALAGLVCIALPSLAAFAAGLALFILAVIADSVDGNLCRLRDRASYFGKFLDGVVDMAADLAFPLALALHLWLAGAASPGILVAGAGAVLALGFVFVLVQRLPMFELLFEKERGEAGLLAGRAAHPRLNAFLAKPAGRALLAFDARGMNLVFDLRYTGLVLALVLGALPTYVVALAALYGVVALLFTISRIARAYAALDVHRRSRTAA